MKAARYLNWRINRRVNQEDTALIRRVQQGMASVLLRAGAARAERSLPQELRAEAPPPDSGDAAGRAAAAGLERAARRMSR